MRRSCFCGNWQLETENLELKTGDLKTESRKLRTRREPQLGTWHSNR